MIKKLSVLGNSAALIIDKPILELLHITPETELEIQTDGERLMITPVKKADAPKYISKEKFKAIQKDIIERHGDVFRKLAQPPK